MEHFLGDINGRYASNKKDILALCSNKASYSVADLSRELCTSIPRVTRIVNEMIQEGYLVETGKQESATGRRPSLYGLNPAAGEFVGIDVEQDSISIAVTDFPGRLVHFSGDLPFHLEGN
jgi:predicted ArsR family transcriptional regulator